MVVVVPSHASGDPTVTTIGLCEGVPVGGGQVLQRHGCSIVRAKRDGLVGVWRGWMTRYRIMHAPFWNMHFRPLINKVTWYTINIMTRSLTNEWNKNKIIMTWMVYGKIFTCCVGDLVKRTGNSDLTMRCLVLARRMQCSVSGHKVMEVD
jgi:hypothetical protein